MILDYAAFAIGTTALLPALQVSWPVKRLDRVWPEPIQSLISALLVEVEDVLRQISLGRVGDNGRHALARA